MCHTLASNNICERLCLCVSECVETLTILLVLHSIHYSILLYNPKLGGPKESLERTQLLRAAAGTHARSARPLPCVHSRVDAPDIPPAQTRGASRPWAPAADILRFATKTFAWLAYACSGFAWR